MFAPGGLPDGEGPGRTPSTASISDAVVRLFSDHTGRGPSKARTTINDRTVMVLLEDTMTKAEHSLVAAGREEEVLSLRRAFQETMRGDLIDVVEEQTGRNVEAFMSANHTDPDLAAEIFVLDRPPT